MSDETVVAWIADALSNASSLVELGLDGKDRAVAETVIATLDARHAEIETLGQEAFLTVLARFSVRATDGELNWLASEASFEERRAASQATSAVAHEVAMRRRAALVALREVLLEVGRAAARVALPFLLAAVRK